jgi:cytochrome P450
MISTDGHEAGLGPARPAPGPEIGVDESLLRALGNRYAEYRQAMSEPFDPVRVLGLTGQVLEAVNQVLGSTEKSIGVRSITYGRLADD